MTIPRKISPSPIVEAVTEIRFDGKLSSEAIFGKLYAPLSKIFDETEQLPILEAPPELRDRPEFKYAPHYRLKNDRFIVNIGPRLISVNRICTEYEYSSWDEYSKLIKQVIEEIKELDLITDTSRVAVRYINFFEQPVTEVLNLKMHLFQSEVKDYKEIALSFLQGLSGGKNLKTSMNSSATIKSERFKETGLLVTFEAYQDNPMQVSEILDAVNDLHGDVEKGFFSALNEEFLKNLKPEY